MFYHSPLRPLRLNILIFLVLAAAITAGSAAAQQSESRPGSTARQPSPPNIIFILIDDLGWSDVGYQYSDHHQDDGYFETPAIDALAARSLIFTNGYANAPNCAPSRACLMSGQWPQRHGIYTVGTAARGKAKQRRIVPVENETTLGDRFITLGEALSQQGYQTAAIGKWHLGDSPTTQGFQLNIAGNHWGSPSGGGYLSPLDYPNLKVDQPNICLTDCLTEAAEDFIEQNKHRPFFLYLAHYAVHTPLQPKPLLLEKYRLKEKTDTQTNAKYAAMIENVDQSVASVWNKLSQLNLEDDTILVFSSDNGGHMGATSNHPLHGAKGMLYEGGIRVPLTIRWPKHLKTGHCDVPVQGIDLYPTLLSMAGLQRPENYPLDGQDISAVFTGDQSEIDKLNQRPLYWHFPAYLEGKGDPSGGPFRTTPASSVRIGDWKLIQWYEDGRKESRVY